MSDYRTYTDNEVRARLATSLPHWLLEGGCLTRVFRTSGWKASLMVVNAIGHLAETAWHHPELALSYHGVTVKLYTRKAGGITDRDFALAGKIEEVIGWQPAKEHSPLRGTPDRDGYRYLEHDDRLPDA